MGNYLNKLRNPPSPSEREQARNHPLYYDWRLPNRTPFKLTAAERATAALHYDDDHVDEEDNSSNNLDSYYKGSSLTNVVPNPLDANAMKAANKASVNRPFSSDRDHVGLRAHLPAAAIAHPAAATNSALKPSEKARSPVLLAAGAIDAGKEVISKSLKGTQSAFSSGSPLIESSSSRPPTAKSPSEARQQSIQRPINVISNDNNKAQTTTKLLLHKTRGAYQVAPRPLYTNLPEDSASTDEEQAIAFKRDSNIHRSAKWMSKETKQGRFR